MSEPVPAESLRARAHHLLTREEGGSGGLTMRAGLVLLIVVSVTTAVLKSVPQIGSKHGSLLDAVLVVTSVAFAIEYLLRIWIAAENPGTANAPRERLNYVLSLPSRSPSRRTSG